MEIVIRTHVGDRLFATAEIQGSPETAVEGSTVEEALAALVTRHQKRFGVTKLTVVSHAGEEKQLPA
jgi:hypothetical protein